MLVKKHRLTRNIDVMRVLKMGKFVRGGVVNLKCFRRTDSESFGVSAPESGGEYQGVGREDPAPTRIAVIVSTKIFKRAVDRNRAKRLVRESIRHLLPEIKAGYDLVFLIQSGIAGMKQGEVQKEVETVLRKTNLLISN